MPYAGGAVLAHDDHETRIGALAHGIEQVAEALDIGVIKWASTSSSTQIGAQHLAKFDAVADIRLR